LQIGHDSDPALAGAGPTVWTVDIISSTADEPSPMEPLTDDDDVASDGGGLSDGANGLAARLPCAAVIAPAIDVGVTVEAVGMAPAPVPVKLGAGHTGFAS